MCTVGHNQIYTSYMTVCVGLSRTEPTHRTMCKAGQNRIYTPYMTACVGLARSVYIYLHAPYIWWFPSQKYRVYTVYIWFRPTLRMYGSSLARSTVHMLYVRIYKFTTWYTTCSLSLPSFLPCLQHAACYSLQLVTTAQLLTLSITCSLSGHAYMYAFDIYVLMYNSGQP